MSAAGSVVAPRGALRGRPAWRDQLAPYTEARVWRSVLDLATSVVPYLALSVVMYLLLDVSYVLVLLVAVPTGGFMLRTYILFHDCTHGSFLPTKRGNAWLGMALWLLVFSPFQNWRHSHAVHHATSGDLDRRGVGDVPMMTVQEFYAKSWGGRLAYRLYRNPLVMFGIGPIYALVVQPRLVSRSARPRNRRSVMWTNVAVAAMVGGMCWLIGWREYLLIQGPTALLAGSAGVFLFYVQHQFEDAYWQDAGDW